MKTVSKTLALLLTFLMVPSFTGTLRAQEDELETKKDEATIVKGKDKSMTLAMGDIS